MFRVPNPAGASTYAGLAYLTYPNSINLTELWNLIKFGWFGLIRQLDSMVSYGIFFAGFVNPTFELPDNLSDSPEFEGV